MSAPSFLQFLDSPAGAALKSDFRERRHARGEAVARAGDSRDEVFVVLSGRLRVHLSDESREMTLMHLEPGDVFTSHTPACVTAALPSRLAVMPTACFRGHLAGQSPAIVSIMRVLGLLLARTIEVVENLVFRETHERLARLLATLARRQGQRVSDESWTLPLPFTLTDMAMMVGASRQTVSGAFADLERRGVVLRHGRRVLHVLDLAQLEAQGRCVVSST